MMPTFHVGDRVFCNGYDSTIAKICDGQLAGMLEVRVPGGLVCVSASEVARFTDAFEVAVVELLKLKVTYIRRHARKIAETSIRANDQAEASASVLALIGHTAVGKRRHAELAERARSAYAKELACHVEPA